jgi:hypothetical protein
MGDFRLHAYETIIKYLAVVQLAWGYIQSRAVSASSRTRSPADVIRQHTDENLHCWLRTLCDRVLRTGDVDAEMKRYFPTAAVA